jgi:riboflavin kinase/FMN adenylyltransferase
MRVIRQIDSETSFNNPILTLGTFDGVHLGHQEIIKSLVEKAKKLNKESILFTFDPHPRKVLHPDSYTTKLIDSIPEKLKKLEELGLDTVVLYPFTRDFSRLSAMEFVRDILVNQIGVSEMHIGYDHHFGKNREGSFAELTELGELYGFQVFQLQAVSVLDTNVSSTKIRKAILEGKVDEAAKMLGNPFQLCGIVVQGNKIGRTIGFPTANIHVLDAEKIIPKNGIYIVHVELEGTKHQGVMSIGSRPTIEEDGAVTIEVFIFDFDQEIYGKQVVLTFLQYIREELRFNNLEELTLKIKEDESIARTYFNQLLPG